MNVFEYEIMVGYIILKLIQNFRFSFKTVSVRGKFYSNKVIMTPSLQSADCSPEAAALLLLGGNWAALLRRQTSGAAEHSSTGRTWRAF